MRLELTRRGDYAVRAMLALAGRVDEPPTSSRQIAAATGIPVGFVPRVMGELVAAGLVASTTGRAGGYALAHEPRAVSLLAVIEAVEGDSRRTTCVLRGGPCGLDGHCQVHDVFHDAQDVLLGRLRDVSLADILRTRPVASPGSRPRRSGQSERTVRAMTVGPTLTGPNGPIG
jgi:Rrf2 family protein